MRWLAWLMAFLPCACEASGDDTTGAGGSTSSSQSATTSSGSGGVIPPPPACDDGRTPSGFFVATDGSPSGDGSVANPWDIATALVDPPGVVAGDTIWLRGGTYTGPTLVKLNGENGAPITVRSYPGEWAVLDSAGSDQVTVEMYRSYTVLRDLEIMNSAADRAVSRPSGIYVEGEGHALVNLVIHDVGTGIICNSASDAYPELAPELTVYGCILFNNGFLQSDGGHGHHLYLQNRDGTKHVLESVLFDAFAFGFHLYSDNDDHYAEGYEVRGNVSFQNGAATPGMSKLYDNFMIGHNGTHPVRRLELHENFGWAQGPGERDVRLGWNAPNEDVLLQDNYFVGQTIFQPSWTSVTMSGNTFYGDMQGVDPTAYPNNDFLTSPPADNVVIVRANAWQPGRAHVIVYNWQGLDAVDVDLSSVLTMGATYELRHVMDPTAAPVASGAWDGTPVSVPMTNLAVAQPIGAPGAVDASETPGKSFAVFLLLGCAP